MSDDPIRDALNSRVRQPRTVEVQIPPVEEYEMAAREVLWLLEGDRELGIEPGSFVASLIRTLCLADIPNLTRAVIAWPAIASTVMAYKQLPDGVNLLRGIARGPYAPGDNPSSGTRKEN